MSNTPKAIEILKALVELEEYIKTACRTALKEMPNSSELVDEVDGLFDDIHDVLKD